MGAMMICEQHGALSLTDVTSWMCELLPLDQRAQFQLSRLRRTRMASAALGIQTCLQSMQIPLMLQMLEHRDSSRREPFSAANATLLQCSRLHLTFKMKKK